MDVEFKPRRPLSGQRSCARAWRLHVRRRAFPAIVPAPTLYAANTHHGTEHAANSAKEHVRRHRHIYQRSDGHRLSPRPDSEVSWYILNSRTSLCWQLFSSSSRCHGTGAPGTLLRSPLLLGCLRLTLFMASTPSSGAPTHGSLSLSGAILVSTQLLVLYSISNGLFTATKVIVGANIALPAACMCVSIHLKQVSSMKSVQTSFEAKRRRQLIEAFFCILLPMIWMAVRA